MNPNEVLKLHNEVMDTWNKHDTERFLKLCDEKIVWNDLGSQQPFKGREGAREFFENWKTAFPDFKLKTINTVITDDSIAAELEFSGTNTGPLKVGADIPEIPATGKKVTANKGVYFGKVKNGKFTQVNTYPDLAGMMMQLGLMQEAPAHA